MDSSATSQPHRLKLFAMDIQMHTRLSQKSPLICPPPPHPIRPHRALGHTTSRMCHITPGLPRSPRTTDKISWGESFRLELLGAHAVQLDIQESGSGFRCATESALTITLTYSNTRRAVLGLGRHIHACIHRPLLPPHARTRALKPSRARRLSCESAGCSARAACSSAPVSRRNRNGRLTQRIHQGVTLATSFTIYSILVIRSCVVQVPF
ncbi:hypothetical protein B0H17DRAFT_1122206 [Mycena rosella]|uniref:Uncharacterized protein n=1 Tax=Mycena rosella TaxID=1033263 RepID=A0AAD7AXD5_MYCRO|nr:hypothetical protein B0H17DRAFT_1122206 [Mycena rosella]